MPKKKSAAGKKRKLDAAPTHDELSKARETEQLFKNNLFKSASSFGGRLLELSPKPDLSTKARKVVALCEQKGGQDAFEYAYDYPQPFVVCNADIVPIYRGSPVVKCTVCNAPYSPAHKGKLCSTCGLGEVGGDASGLTDAVVLARD